MTSLKNPFLFNIALVLLLIIGCDSPPKNRINMFLSQECKDYCLFKVNSQWIYQNEQTLDYDTVIYIGIQPEILSSSHSPIDSERIKIAIQKKKFTTDSIITLESGFGKNESMVFSAYGDLNYFDGETYNQDSISSHYNVKYANFYDTISFNNNIFKLVKRFNITKIDVYNIYWAKNVGVIRLEKTNGEIWNLVKFEINQ